LEVEPSDVKVEPKEHVERWALRQRMPASEQYRAAGGEYFSSAVDLRAASKLLEKIKQEQGEEATLLEVMGQAGNRLGQLLEKSGTTVTDDIRICYPARFTAVPNCYIFKDQGSNAF
jgi:hypothetical protein